MSCGDSESKFRTTEEQETSCERSSYSPSPTRQSDPRPLKSRVHSLGRRFLLFRLLAVVALSRAERSLHGERESNTRVLCQKSLYVGFPLWTLFVTGFGVWTSSILVGISPCFATITGLRTDPCVYRNLCFSFSCVVPKWRHFSLFSVKLFLLQPPLRPLPDFLVPRFGGLRAFIADGEGTCCWMMKYGVLAVIFCGIFK